VRFRAFLGKGSSEFKNTTQIFLQKVYIENIFQKKRQSFDVSFPLGFFFYRGFGVSQRWEFKPTTKNVLQNKSCRKLFTKKLTKIQNRFSQSRFWAFLGEGSSKTPPKKTISHKKI
jgi:hypothetical protein